MQIAYRLAHRVGQKTVYGIDEQSDTIDYFPFDKVQAYAKAHHQTAALDRMQEKVEKKVKAEEAAQKTIPIRLLLAQMNEPAQVRADHDEFYDGLLAFGDQKEQPGADLNAAWYLRNAKIFAELTQIAQPGDRASSERGTSSRCFTEAAPAKIRRRRLSCLLASFMKNV